VKRRRKETPRLDGCKRVTVKRENDLTKRGGGSDKIRGPKGYVGRQKGYKKRLKRVGGTPKAER